VKRLGPTLLSSEVAGVTVEQTQQILDRYFGLMGKDEDFAVCFTADVTWLVAETDELIKGPHVVRDYITALHSRMVDGHGYRPSWVKTSSTWREIVPPRVRPPAGSTIASPTR